MSFLLFNGIYEWENAIFHFIKFLGVKWVSCRPSYLFFACCHADRFWLDKWSCFGFPGGVWMAQGPEARLLVWEETKDLTFFSAQVMRNDSRYSTPKRANN